MNTCSSLCSQPNTSSQQIPFRYFDSNIVRKNLPLVVSFKRINKLEMKSNDDASDVVSICDIHRLKELNLRESLKNKSTQRASFDLNNSLVSCSSAINFKPNGKKK